MQSNIVTFPGVEAKAGITATEKLATINYNEAEQQFIQLLERSNLDKDLDADPSIATDFEQAIATAIQEAYTAESNSDEAHFFLQRTLYRINRLKLFWYDDLRHYTNERSAYLHSVRDRIEASWQEWELAHLDAAALQQLDVTAVKQALIERSARDLDPPLSEDSRYLREQMNEAGYRRVLAISSFDGLVEGSRLSRILGGAANEIQSTLTKVLLEEYGNGRLSRKHSTFLLRC